MKDCVGLTYNAYQLPYPTLASDDSSIGYGLDVDSSQNREQRDSILTGQEGKSIEIEIR